MRILRIKCVRYCSYASLCVCLMLLWFSVWFDDPSTSSKQLFDGPVQMKVAHVYDIDNKYTDPDLNPMLKSFRCSKLAINEEREMSRAVTYLQKHKHQFKSRPDEDYINLVLDCEKFIKSRGYFHVAPSIEEKTFPIAFNILFYTNIEQLERLLRSIYRPQNQYCIHVDAKCADDVISAVRKLTECFPNVFLASKLEVVVYASYTRLTADISCMKDHLEREYKWDYLINMAASEFPVMSNLQLVHMLKDLHGANDVHEVFKTIDKERFESKHFTYIDLRTKTGYMIHTKDKKDPPPSGLVITKGNAYNIFSRKFVEFALKSDVARQLLAWSADTYTPDEHYWATLNNLYNNSFLNTPGGYKGRFVCSTFYK